MRLLLVASLAWALGGGFAAHAADPRCARPVDLFQPNRGVISNAKIAKAIALTYLIPIYGEATVRHEMPFTAALNNEVWTVNGTLPPGWIGGTAQILLCQRNGMVLSIIHFK